MIKTQSISIQLKNETDKNVQYTPTHYDGYECIGVVGFSTGSYNYFALQVTKSNIYVVNYNHLAENVTLPASVDLLYIKAS